MGYQYPRQAILAPTGIVTEPNEYGQYPAGALRTARNVVLRAPGKLSQAPNIQNQVAVGGAGTIDKLAPADTGIVYAFGNNAGTWSIFADGVAETFVGSAVNAFSATGRISWAQCVERVIVNGEFGCLVRDPVPISTKWRAAGLPQLSIVDIGILGTPGFLLPDQSVSYRVCLVRRYSQDYTLRSTPSVVARYHTPTLPATSSSPVVAVAWPTNAGVEPGDVIELYRTDILATTSATADTGATFKLVQEYTLTAANISFPPVGGLLLSDTQPPALGTLKTAGRELYTNPGVEGETYANLRPPIAECLASFKGFCFYGNTTERAQLTFQIPGGWGSVSQSVLYAGIDTTTARRAGIGHRTGSTAVVTAGSAVITGVSAADIVGVVPGQRSVDGNFPPGTTVVSVGATTITMSAPAIGASAFWATTDVIEINGVVYTMQSVSLFVNALAGLMEVEFSQAISPNVLYYGAFEFTLMWNSHSFARSITARATNGQNYSPPLPQITAAVKSFDPIVRKNRVAWSKEQQPEHAPSVSETLAGFGEMYAMNATRDALWIWCSDGLFRLSGNAGSLGLGAWQLDYANSTLLLCAPQASTVLAEKLYGYTNEGVVEIDTAGNLRNLTVGIIGDLVPGPRYKEVPGIILERNEQDDEILLATGDTAAGLSDQVFIYNVRQRGWTRLSEFVVGLASICAIAMFRLPPAGGQARVLIGAFRLFGGPVYHSWDSSTSFLAGSAQFQPIYGDDPLELKRWMWADYLFDRGSLTGTVADVITVLWNSISFGPVPFRALDAGVYARAGCPRSVGLSHSIMPGFSWAASTVQRAFEGLSIAVKQRTNQSKAR